MSSNGAVQEDLEQLRNAFKAIVSSPLFHDMFISNQERVNHVTSTIPAPDALPPSSAFNCEDEDATELRRLIAHSVVKYVQRARLRDPLAILPTDVAVYLLGFFMLREIVRVRRVNRQWCQAGNAYLATVQSFFMRKDGKNDKRSAVLVLRKRFSSLVTLDARLFGEYGHAPQDVIDVMLACSSVTSLRLTPQDFCAYRHQSPTDDRTPSFAPIAKAVATSGCFRALLTLVLELYMGDKDASAIAGHLPCLQALHISGPGDAWPVSPSQHVLSSRGVATLINGAPSLTILQLTYSADLTNCPFPTCRSGIRRLCLEEVELNDDALRCLLTHVGSELRTIALRYCERISNASVQYVADSCPQLENLDLYRMARITPACLPSIAQMPCLRTVSFDRLSGHFKPEDITWLHQHASSSALREHTQPDRYDYRPVCSSLLQMLCAENIPMTDMDAW